MTKKTYSDLLRDPRWQKKRLEILNRDGWACKICDHTDKTLHVHHRFYKQGAMPWDYDDSWLIVLCEDCHEEETSCLKRERDFLNDMLALCGMDSSGISEISLTLHALHQLGLNQDGILDVLCAVQRASKTQADLVGLLEYGVSCREKNNARS